MRDLLDDAGHQVQARAPMTPVAKLVFGADYDKTRLTEFAAVLSHARAPRRSAAGGLAAFLEAVEGGIKGVVAAERALRRTPAKPDLLDAIAAELRERPPLGAVSTSRAPATASSSCCSRARDGDGGARHRRAASTATRR